MSILLDALRKSEQRKRAGDVPTIHAAAPVSEGGRRALTPVSVGLVLLPLFVLAVWLTWRQYGASPPPEQPPAQSVVAEAGATAAQAAPARERDTPGATVKRTASPVENLPPGPALQRAPGKNQAVKAETRTAAAQPAVTQSAKGSVPAQKGSVPAPSGEQAAPAELTSQENDDTWSPGQPQPISYWQLPENLRKEIGEIKITVFVYADKPADRFILMDGRRQAEGDMPRPGLKVESIEPEGVVFSYRLYRFVVRR